ncbi:unnamed protein product, partial [Amoebophrya sp. A120]|eukprot:GSA120T00026233001.1
MTSPGDKNSTCRADNASQISVIPESAPSAQIHSSRLGHINFRRIMAPARRDAYRSAGRPRGGDTKVHRAQETCMKC